MNGHSEPFIGTSETLSGPSEPFIGPSQPLTGPSEPSIGPSEPFIGPSEPLIGPSEPLIWPVRTVGWSLQTVDWPLRTISWSLRTVDWPLRTVNWSVRTVVNILQTSTANRHRLSRPSATVSTTPGPTFRGQGTTKSTGVPVSGTRSLHCFCACLSLLSRGTGIICFPGGGYLDRGIPPFLNVGATVRLSQESMVVLK